MPSIFFTADLHLGHAGILTHQPSRHEAFDNTYHMDDVIIDTINSLVSKNDELWILGDFAWKASKYGHYRHRLNVRKIHVIRGNHDSSSLRAHVSSMNDMVYKKFAGVKFHMTHYPMASWRAREHGSVHLYGHSHGSIENDLNTMYPGRRSMDIGVDCAYARFGVWRPFLLNEIFQLLGVDNDSIRACSVSG